MKTPDQIIEIAVGNSESHTVRMQALDAIKDESVFKFLAENAVDEWIRLESAIRGKITKVLNELKNHADERIVLEAAIETNDQKKLTEMALHSKDVLLQDIATNYIDDDALLRSIVHSDASEKVRVAAALRLGDIPLSRILLEGLQKEDLKLKMGQFLSDRNTMAMLSEKAKDKRVKQIAQDWLLSMSSDPDDEID